MVVSIGWFQIFTWKMVVSPNIHKKLVVWSSRRCFRYHKCHPSSPMTSVTLINKIHGELITKKRRPIPSGTNEQKKPWRFDSWCRPSDRLWNNPELLRGKKTLTLYEPNLSWKKKGLKQLPWIISSQLGHHGLHPTRLSCKQPCSYRQSAYQRCKKRWGWRVRTWESSCFRLWFFKGYN